METLVDEYINKWMRILSEMVNDNTYKLAWGRAIIEICMNKKNIDNCQLKITFQEIGKKMLKYYWNQLFYFNLKQSKSRIDQREPEIIQYVKELIDYYKIIYQTNKPEWFNKVYPSDDISLNIKFKRIIEKDIPTTLSHDVCWRFPKVKDTDDIGIYSLDKANKFILIESLNVKKIQQYGEILINLFNYKWSLLLEKYNIAPKIGNKVKGIGDEHIKRNSLELFKKILLLQYGENHIRDFYTEQIIPIDEISIDHVIPWSFVYEDNIWNLVITSKSNNSKKSNFLVNQNYIDKLENRNMEMLKTLKTVRNNKLDSYINDLEYANENHVVKEMYNYFKG